MVEHACDHVRGETLFDAPCEPVFLDFLVQGVVAIGNIGRLARETERRDVHGKIRNLLLLLRDVAPVGQCLAVFLQTFHQPRRAGGGDNRIELIKLECALGGELRRERTLCGSVQFRRRNAGGGVLRIKPRLRIDEMFAIAV